MDSKGYAEVKVSVVGNEVRCAPDPVKCNWQAGPDDIRWTFQNLPENVASVVIEWKTKPMHRGIGHAPSSVDSHLADLVTTGNVCVGGRYFYHVHCLDAQGQQVAYADPSGQNDPPA
jgi:hypothetical protein